MVAFHGGNDTNHETFSYNDWEVEFDYFGEDLDTAEKMIDYLDVVYSQRMIEYLFMKYDWIEHDGKLARPLTGLGSLASWQDLVFLNIERTATEMVVSVEVPLGDTGQVIEEEVILIYSEEKSWLLDTEIR
ncbi:hypothetical protein CIB95_09675 [Lottiidibacillus patelloidae]|uniref:Uncharacterized protein n=1 Tax=Lottiidibacillus patelloidae TaxID=2670334 RepID=A0A263BTJ9_9BACI|nr:DL-endopeptidase inhibitor IseA family protein [Lottiidibacillus patelloidae]OZM57029.1 hypothetical protein CIB95_09675 [Lottiidibacillus patelloidae]